jgi:peptidoglycan hydrolase CwlO-like protein
VLGHIFGTLPAINMTSIDLTSICETGSPPRLRGRAAVLAGKAPTSGSKVRHSVKLWARRAVATCPVVLVGAITTALVVVPPAPAGADQISSLQAEATQISQQLIQEQLQVGALQQQYAVATQKLQQDAQAIGQTEAQLDRAQRQVQRDRSLLRKEALVAYTTDSAASLGGVQQLFGGNGKNAAVETEYEQMVSGEVSNRIDDVRNDENSLRAVEGTLQHEETLDQATASRQADLAQQATNTQAQLEALQSKVTGQLAAAVAQQEAAQAAAAAAAVRAAEAAAAAKQAAAATPATPVPAASAGAQQSSSAPAPAQPSAPAGSVSPSAAPSSGSGGGPQVLSDPTLPPFLQCVIQAESGGNYGAVSPGGTYMGAFQFSQATWNEAAILAGLPQLVGVPPNEASPADQDALAIALYTADGEQPWYDPCTSGG